METENKDWFVDWFNSPYYHILYKNRDHKEAENFINNLSNLLLFQKEDHLLDLACGKGRHAIYLNNLGYQVTGLDLSEENICYAKQFENNRLKFAVHDMREIFVGTKFNFVLNLFTSFGYFDSLTDNIKMLKSVHSMLNWNGHLVIDFFNSEQVIKQLVPEEIKRIDGIDFKINKEYSQGKILKTIRFSDLGKSFEFTEVVQAILFKEFKSILNETGFQLIYTFGDYNLNPFKAESSGRLILVAKKM